MINYELIAKRVKSLLAENSVYRPPVPVYSIAENLGLVVKFGEISPESADISGFIDFSNTPNTIYVNRKDCIERQAFTIAHEIGHYQLHKELYERNPSSYKALYRQALNKDGLSDEEKEANCFAAQLLVPKPFYEEVRQKYPFINDSALAKLFGVSQDVIRYRYMAFARGWN